MSSYDELFGRTWRDFPNDAGVLQGGAIGSCPKPKSSAVAGIQLPPQRAGQCDCAAARPISRHFPTSTNQPVARATG